MYGDTGGENEGRHILLVEDEVIIALNQAKILTAAGFLMSLAHTWDAAFEKMRGNRISLVLMDIDLGDGTPDGTELAKAILREFDVPILFLSSHTEDDIVANTERITSYGYVVKNSSSTVLIASIKMAFRLFSARRKEAKAASYLQAIIQSAPLSVCILDSEGVIVQINKTYCEKTGFSEQEILGKHVCDIDIDISSEEVNQRLAFVREGGRECFRVRHKRKNGGTIIFELTTAPPIIDDQILFVTFLRDISAELAVQSSWQLNDNRYRDVLESMGEIVLVLNLNGTIEDVYGTWPSMFGMKRSGLLGKRLSYFLPDEAAEQHEIQLSQILNKTMLRFEWSYLYGSEELRFQTSLSLRYNIQGQPDGIVLIARDISQVQRTEHLLLEAEKMAQIGNWQYDVELDHMKWSVSMYEILGVTSERMPASYANYLKQIHGQERNKFKKQILLAMQDCTDIRLKHRIEVEGAGIKWISIHGKVKCNSSGKPVRASGFIQDITHQEMQYQQLTVQRSRLASIIDAVDIGTWQWNARTGEVVFNEAWASMLGYTLEELEPLSLETWSSLTHPEDLEMANECLQRHFRGETEGYECEIRMKHSKGHWVWILDRGRVLEWSEPGMPEWMFGIHMDISEKKANSQELKNTVASQHTLMQEMNHRVKNNLGILAALIDLKNQDIGGAADLSDLHSRVHTLHKLYDHLVEQKELHRIELQGYLESITHSLIESAPFPIHLEMDIERQTVSTKCGLSLGLMLNELATNAIKHAFAMEQGNKFSVNGRRNGQMYRFVISNNGTPLPEHFSMEGSSSMGMLLMGQLLDQIGATMRYSSNGDDDRTHFSIEFSVEQFVSSSSSQS